MGKFTFFGTHGTLSNYMYCTGVRRVMLNNLRHSDWFETVGEQLAHTHCSDFDKPCLYHPLMHPNVITFCPISLSKLFWAFIYEYVFSFLQIRSFTRAHIAGMLRCISSCVITLRTIFTSCCTILVFSLIPSLK